MVFTFTVAGAHSKLGRSYPHLSLDKGRKIANRRYANMPVLETADRLCRARSTIYRELRRNSVRFDEQPEPNDYHALNAQDLYEDRRAVHRKLIRFRDIMTAVHCGFDAGWSP